MDALEKLEFLQKQAQEITSNLRKVSREVSDNTEDLKRCRSEISGLLGEASEKLSSSIADIPKKVHVTHERGLTKQSRNLVLYLSLAVLLTTGLVAWLLPKGQLEYIKYQNKKLSEQEEMLQFFKERCPITLKAWNKKKQEKQ